MTRPMGFWERLRRALPFGSLQVRSLRWRIAIQVAFILMPLGTALLIHSRLAADQSQSLTAAMQRVTRLRVAHDDYQLFMNGVVEAADSGDLPPESLAALFKTLDEMRQYQAIQQGMTTSLPEKMVANLADMHQRLSAAPSFATLTRVQPELTEVRNGLENIIKDERIHLAGLAADIAEAAQRQAHISLAVLAISLLVAIYFIWVMIRGLSTPLTQAVALAARIADGNLAPTVDDESSEDLGGLLHSLELMRAQLHRMFSTLEQNEWRLANAQRIGQMGYWEMDLATGQTFWSPAACAVLVREAGVLTAQPGFPMHIVLDSDRERVAATLQGAIQAGGKFEIDFSLVPVEGDPVGRRIVSSQAEVRHDSQARAVAIAGTVQDITARKLAEERIRSLGLHDTLTGLPNRLLFREHVDRAIDISIRTQAPVAVLFIDLDGFKYVNDTFGHAAGDEVLRETALRLQNSLRQVDRMARPGAEELDVVSRQGGDEFTVLIGGLAHVEDAARVAQRILDAIQQPYSILGQEMFVGASIGIAACPTDCRDTENLLKNADAAMYHAKDSGRNNYQFYSGRITELVARRLELDSAMRQAVARNELVLYFEPIIDIRTAQIVCMEALIRWNHPERGLVSPGEFIPLAEETGMIVPLTEWVIAAACAQGRRWQAAGLSAMPISINIASATLRQKNLMQVLRDAGALASGSHFPLVLELTERSLVDDRDNTVHHIQELRRSGIGISVDDFGTGYSSLSYLRRFPVDSIKIDMSFVQSAPHNQQDQEIIRAILALGNALDVGVIAEGIETREQLSLLGHLGCYTMQGYYFSRPMPAEQVEVLLKPGGLGLPGLRASIPEQFRVREA